MPNPVVDFYRCPASFADFDPPAEINPTPGFFTFGAETICYGQSLCNGRPHLNGAAIPDVYGQVRIEDALVRLPFDAAAIVDNLRLERYPTGMHGRFRNLLLRTPIRHIYYYCRPAMSDSLRQTLQRYYFRDYSTLAFPRWPVDTTVERFLMRLLLLSMKARNVERIPFIWFWPDGALSSAIVTHDVETESGLAAVPRLMDIDEGFGVPASFQLVPQRRYSVSPRILDQIRARQFEVNVHGFDHDGNLFDNRQEFLRQAKQINRYAHEFGAKGFRSACMYRNPDWFEELDISYDMSVPNVAHLEPQRGGCCTVFPYFIGKTVELPLTAIQDYSLFRILGDYSINLWKQQIESIRAQYGLVSFIIHPDYIFTLKALPVYKELLSYLSRLGKEQKMWIARPGEVNTWWRERNEMKLVRKDGKWTVDGYGRERARIAYARLEGEQIVYNVGPSYEE